MIGAFWMAHHRFFALLHRFDATLMQLNLAFLAFISLMPFTTALMGRYGDVEIAVILYAVNVVCASAFDTAMLWVALRRGLVPPETDHPGAMLLGNFTPGLVFLLSIPLVLVDPAIGPFSWLVLFAIVSPLSAQARRRLRGRA